MEVCCQEGAVFPDLTLVIPEQTASTHESRESPQLLISKVFAENAIEIHFSSWFV